jgi:DNA topoisomerase IB
MTKKSKFNIFEFKFGKEKKDIFHYVRLGFLLKGTVDVISLLPFVNRKSLFNFIDEAQLHFGIDVLNDYIIQDEELLKFRIDRVIAKTIEEYEKHS